MVFVTLKFKKRKWYINCLDTLSGSMEYHFTMLSCYSRFLPGHVGNNLETVSLIYLIFIDSLAMKKLIRNVASSGQL